jgi:hypothetical protein
MPKKPTSPAYRRFPVPYEMAAIDTLHRAGELAGCDIVEASGGVVPAHQVYMILRRLKGRGIVKVAKHEPPATGGAPRAIYELTPWGRKVQAAIEVLSK